jgi:succinyl-CoA:(S)-malate CoA-transferase subunit B
VRLCAQAEVPCGIVAAIDEIFNDPQYAARENIVRVADERLDADLAVPNVVPRLTGTPGSVDTLGPALGAHNAQVYGGLLGFDADQLASLESEGVV